MLRTAAAIWTVLALSAGAHANPLSLVPGGTDPAPGARPGVAQEKVDIFVGVDYEYEQDRSLLRREDVGAPGTDPNGPVPVRDDLRFDQFRHRITPHVDVGIYHDTFAYAALPIVISQARELRLDSGVDRASSSTIMDGLLPAEGFDERDPGTPTAGNLVFRGIGRHGLDQVYLGLGYAPMNQRRDDTKPTWRLGAELRLAVGTIMKLDPMQPGSNTGVSKGVHELKLWTSFDRKLGWIEPWVNLWWQVPLAAKADSLFQDPGFGARNTSLGQQAGAEFGFEAYAVQDAEDNNRISLDLGTRVVAHFEGRDYSELWEVFSLAGDSRGMGPLILDADPTKSGVQALSYPGISNIENYLETAARVAVHAEIGTHVRFAAFGDFAWKTDHVITFADAGVDLPTCTGATTSSCEPDVNDLVNPGTVEVNPLHVQRIDLVGHRYRSEGNFGLMIGVQGLILF